MMEKMVRFGIGLRRALVAAVVVFLLAGIAFAIRGVKDATAASPAAEVSYPLKTFQNGKARFYSLPAGKGITIKYFILKSSDGVIRAAFDACDVCWQEGKGYAQQGDFMVCTNCARRFASVRVNEAQGGCNPAPLNRKIRGDKVILELNDIQQGEKYFAFEKRGGR